VVGVLSSGSIARFSLVEVLEDATIPLTDGVPLQGVVENRSSQYYKYTVVKPGVDVIISLTSLNGDPGELILP
jgi:hypothetical protein